MYLYNSSTRRPGNYKRELHMYPVHVIMYIHIHVQYIHVCIPVFVEEEHEKRKEAVCVNISNHIAHHLFSAICRSRAGQYMQWRILSNDS